MALQTRFSESPPATAGRQRQRALIGRALAHVEAHLDQPLDAAVLADQAALSRHHFHRLFRAQVGCSVGSYITWRRLQRACALLSSGREPVLEIALAVGFESAQSLAKALRRELGTSPSAVRCGQAPAWVSVVGPAASPHLPFEGAPCMPLTRWAELPANLVALTATARGMVDNSLERAARQAFGELMPAIARAGQRAGLRSVIALCPDDPTGPDDPHCRYMAGAVFGHAMSDGTGEGCQPDIPLGGSLAWQPLSASRYAVFTHVGPYSMLHRTWDAVYAQWLPDSGLRLRDAPPMELCINFPDNTPPDKLITEIWLPVQTLT